MSFTEILRHSAVEVGAYMRTENLRSDSGPQVRWRSLTPSGASTISMGVFPPTTTYDIGDISPVPDCAKSAMHAENGTRNAKRFFIINR